MQCASSRIVEHQIDIHLARNALIMARLSKLSRSVAGKVVIVTGAASGMGRATAHLFADEGALVAATDISPIGPVIDEIVGAGGKARGWQLDVSSRADIDRVVAEIAAHFGGIDILINNAGISLHGAVDTEDFESRWARSLDVLLTGQVRMIRASLPHLRKATDARIVNIASTEGLGATRFISPYTAAKTGVIGLTRSLAVELGPEGITVNCICPGPINTGMTDRIAPEQKAEFARRRTALRRYAEPEEVAHMTLSLCLPSAGFTTGVALPIDGGLTIRNA
jgi:3-oxoacyl-[acyl-carrier protein] reductase